MILSCYLQDKWYCRLHEEDQEYSVKHLAYVDSKTTGILSICEMARWKTPSLSLPSILALSRIDSHPIRTQRILWHGVGMGWDRSTFYHLWQEVLPHILLSHHYVLLTYIILLYIQVVFKSSLSETQKSHQMWKRSIDISMCEGPK